MSNNDLQQQAREDCHICGLRPVSKYDAEMCERCRHWTIHHHHENLHGPGKYILGRALTVAERYVRLKMVERTATLRHENNMIRKRNERLTAAAEPRETMIRDLKTLAESHVKEIEALRMELQMQARNYRSGVALSGMSRELATLRTRVAELELEVEITAREALDRIAELEGMVDKGHRDDCDATDRGFFCTRHEGHTGNHVAHDYNGREVASW